MINALATCRAWHSKKPVLCLHAVTDKDGHPLENEDESGGRLCEYWGTICQARVEGERHHHYENILRYVQKAPDDIRWEIDRNEFDELMAAKKESASDPDGISYGLHRCAGGLGAQFLFNASKHVLEGGAIPALFAESRTVFNPKSSDVYDNGRIVRTGVRGDWVRRFCSTITNMCWRVVLFLRILSNVELSLSPSPPISTTMEEL